MLCIIVVKKSYSKMSMKNAYVSVFVLLNPSVQTYLLSSTVFVNIFQKIFYTTKWMCFYYLTDNLKICMCLDDPSNERRCLAECLVALYEQILYVFPLFVFYCVIDNMQHVYCTWLNALFALVDSGPPPPIYELKSPLATVIRIISRVYRVHAI